MSTYLNNDPFHYTNCSPDWGYFPKCLFKQGSPYETSDILTKDGYYDYEKESTWNKLSYIPLFNIFIGVLRLNEALSEGNKQVRNLKMIRGCTDILLGPLNVIIDLVVTIARVTIANSANRYHSCSQAE